MVHFNVSTGQVWLFGMISALIGILRAPIMSMCIRRDSLLNTSNSLRHKCACSYSNQNQHPQRNNGRRKDDV